MICYSMITIAFVLLMFPNQKCLCAFSKMSHRSISNRSFIGSLSSQAFDWEIWWKDLISSQRSKGKESSLKREKKSGDLVGKIARCATKKNLGMESRPSSRKYTTRKTEVIKVEILVDGMVGDYNHYRTIALANTTDRAVSILTLDVIDMLKCEKEPWNNIQNGDLGENLLIEGLLFNDFQIGNKVRIYDPNLDSKINVGVVLEITEPIVPCANLCKLPCINDSDLDPKDRIETCKHFLERLAEEDGLRGWYAKVLQAGFIEKGYCIEIC